MDVDRALRPAGGARRVDHHHRRLGVERGCLQLGTLAADELVPAVVAAGRHRRVCPEPVPDDRVAHGRRAREGLVGHLLHRHRPAPARHCVGGEEGHGAGVVEPGGHRGRREAREDRDDDRADLADRVEAGDRLDRHRQEEADGVATAHAELEQGVCQPVRLGGELPVCHALDPAVLALPHDRWPVGRMPVDAVLGQVQLAAAEPGRPLDAAGGVEDALVRPRPLDSRGSARPRPRTTRRRRGCARSARASPRCRARA